MHIALHELKFSINRDYKLESSWTMKIWEIPKQTQQFKRSINAIFAQNNKKKENFVVFLLEVHENTKANIFSSKMYCGPFVLQNKKLSIKMFKTRWTFVETHLCFQPVSWSYSKPKVPGLLGHREFLQDMDQVLRLWSMALTQTFWWNMSQE